MPRTAAQGDFQVHVEGVGPFVFGRRTPRDVFRIRGEYDRLTGGNYNEDGTYGDVVALAWATVDVLMVDGPADFKPNEADPLTQDDWDAKPWKVYTALREKERSFRPSSGEAGPAASA